MSARCLVAYPSGGGKADVMVVAVTLGMFGTSSFHSGPAMYGGWEEDDSPFPPPPPLQDMQVLGMEVDQTKDGRSRLGSMRRPSFRGAPSTNISRSSSVSSGCTGTATLRQSDWGLYPSPDSVDWRDTDAVLRLDNLVNPQHANFPGVHREWEFGLMAPDLYKAYQVAVFQAVTTLATHSPPLDSEVAMRVEYAKRVTGRRKITNGAMYNGKKMVDLSKYNETKIPTKIPRSPTETRKGDDLDIFDLVSGLNSLLGVDFNYSRMHPTIVGFPKGFEIPVYRTGGKLLNSGITQWTVQGLRDNLYLFKCHPPTSRATMVVIASGPFFLPPEARLAASLRKMDGSYRKVTDSLSKKDKEVYFPVCETIKHPVLTSSGKLFVHEGKILVANHIMVPVNGAHLHTAPPTPNTKINPYERHPYYLTTTVEFEAVGEASRLSRSWLELGRGKPGLEIPSGNGLPKIFRDVLAEGEENVYQEMHASKEGTVEGGAVKLSPSKAIKRFMKGVNEYRTHFRCATDKYLMKL